MIPDQEAASILRKLLRKEMTPAAAIRAWPKAKVSQPSARSYIEYFRDGVDGRGTRSAQVDGMVAELADLLDKGGESAWDPATESWQVSGEPVAQARSGDEVLLRMVASLFAYERAQIDLALRDGTRGFAAVDREAGQLSGAVKYLFGTDDLEDDERAVLLAPTGKISSRVLHNMFWRVECVGVLAWSLGKVSSLPKPSERFDFAALQHLTDDLTPETIRASAGTHALRPVKELLAARAWYRKELAATKVAIAGHEDSKELQLERSRAYERYRALVWLLNSQYPSLAAAANEI